MTQRTDTRPKLTNCSPYIVEVIAPYQSQLVYEIVRFFSEVQDHLDLHLQRYTPSNTDAQMFFMTLTIYLPLNASLADASRGLYGFVRCTQCRCSDCPFNKPEEYYGVLVNEI